ncbi:MAG: RNA polymerase sigma factor [Cellulosilyticaceae bacterium]
MNQIDLVKEVQEGNMKAFEQLFENYKGSALKTIYLLTNNKSMSEDILQEVFVLCYLNIKSLRNPSYFKTWFFKILTHTTWTYMKKEGKLILTEDMSIYTEAHTSTVWQEDIRANEMKSELYEQIERLEVKLKVVVILYYYNDFSIREIAKTMGCLEGTVKSRLYRARKQLEENLRQVPMYNRSREVLEYES